MPTPRNKHHAFIVPPGSVVIRGRSDDTQAAALAAHYGKRSIITDWTPDIPLPPDALALTGESHLINAISLKNALRAAGLQP